MFDEHSRPSGTASTMARKVPQTAICTVTIISSRYMRQSRKFGGKKSAANCAMLPESRNRSIGRMSAPRQDMASRARMTAHVMSMGSDERGAMEVREAWRAIFIDQLRGMKENKARMPAPAARRHRRGGPECRIRSAASAYCLAVG